MRRAARPTTGRRISPRVDMYFDERNAVAAGAMYWLAVSRTVAQAAQP